MAFFTCLLTILLLWITCFCPLPILPALFAFTYWFGRIHYAFQLPLFVSDRYCNHRSMWCSFMASLTIQVFHILMSTWSLLIFKLQLLFSVLCSIIVSLLRLLRLFSSIFHSESLTTLFLSSVWDRDSPPTHTPYNDGPLPRIICWTVLFFTHTQCHPGQTHISIEVCLWFPFCPTGLFYTCTKNTFLVTVALHTSWYLEDKSSFLILLQCYICYP